MLPSLSPPGCGLGVVIGGCAVQAMVSAQKSTRQQHFDSPRRGLWCFVWHSISNRPGVSENYFFLETDCKQLASVLIHQNHSDNYIDIIAGDISVLVSPLQSFSCVHN